MHTLPWMAAAPPARAQLRGAISTPMPGGDAGVSQTMSLIRQLVDAAIKDPYINRTAIQILQQSNAPQYDQLAAAHTIYDWVLRNIRYVQDPVGKETVRPASVILEVRAGDCDDINGVLLPSLLGTIGIATRGVTVAAARGSNDFSHIYAEANLNGQWVALDAARPNVSFGQAPEMYSRRAEWPLTGEEVGQGYLAGMAPLGEMGDASQWISAIGQDASAIISALNPPIQPPPGAFIPGQSVLTPSGAYSTVPGSNVTVSSNISPTEILICVGLLAFAVTAMRLH